MLRLGRNGAMQAPGTTGARRWAGHRRETAPSLKKSTSNLRDGLERVKLDLFDLALDGDGVQLVARQIEAGRLGCPAREHERAIVVLGQAFEPRGGVHGIADRGDD